MTRQEAATAAGPEQAPRPSGPSPRPGPGLDGVTLVRTVATALVRLSRWRDVGDRVYADGVQSAYNHLVLRAIACGGEPPASVPDMVTWAGRTPLAQWPTGLSAAGTRRGGTRWRGLPGGRRDPHPDASLLRVGDGRPGRACRAVRERGDR